MFPRSQDLPVIGLCRFSYPAQGGFQVEHDTIRERISYLYSAERMEDRFRHFETVALPGLKAQTDPNFTFLILIGDTMPPAYRDRLRQMIADFPQARIVTQPTGNHRKVCQAVINEARGGHTVPCLQFRHDDDDAVALNFVERFRETVDDTSRMMRRHDLMAIDFSKGYLTEMSEAGIRAEQTVTPYWGVALGMVVQSGTRLSIMNFAHNKMQNFMPTVTNSDSPMYIRGHNDFNDSRQNLRPKAKQHQMPLLDADGDRQFKELFAIDADHIRRVFG